MAKVTVKHESNETPSQAIMKSASQAHTVTTESGRVIGVRKMLALDRLKMFEVIGPENAKNEPYLGYAALAFSVASIDGEPISRPNNKLVLEGLIQRLGDDGMNAIGEEIQKMYPQADDAGQVAQIKN